MGIIDWIKKKYVFPVTEKDHHIIQGDDPDLGISFNKDLYDLLKEESPPAYMLYLFGNVFYCGWFDVPKDIPRGLYYYHRASKAGFANAQYFLGQYYAVNEHHAKTVYYLRLAAQQNHSDAQWRLGLYYLANLDEFPGKILPAMQLFCRSHVLGNAEGTMQLNRMISFDEERDRDSELREVAKRTVEELRNGQEPRFGNNW